MLRSALVATILLACGTAAASADDTAKTREDKLKALTLNVPESWKQSAQKSSMRLATYEIPGPKEDDAPAELAIYNFPGGGGPVESNIRRWIGQFESKGRTTKVTIGSANEKPYYVVEVTGTYNQPVGPPIRRQTKPVEGARMLAVILQLDQGVYYLKLTGPDETVKAQSDALRAAFGGNVKTEKEHK